MSRFVDNLRSLLSKHFVIREEEMGEQAMSIWRAMGLDLSIERPLTIHVMMPTEDAAMELAFRAEGLPAFFRASIGQVAELSGMTTELALTFFMKAEAETLDALDRLITAMGADLGALSDGWSSDDLIDDAETRAA